MSKRLLQKITDKGFCLLQCPATCGRQTKTTAAGWARTCRATYRDETGPLPCGAQRLVKSYCEQCGMATIPPEVEIAAPAAMLPPGHKIVASPPIRRNLRMLVVCLLVAAAMASECGAVTVTAFAARHGEKTSTGTTPVPGRTAAVSRDMRHLIGKRIHIKGIGWRVVESVTHRKLRRTIDVLVASRATAKKFGRKNSDIVEVRYAKN